MGSCPVMEPVSTETVYAAAEILGGCKRVHAAIKMPPRGLNRPAHFSRIQAKTPE